MKKIYSILLFAFIATAFISCNNDDDNNSSNLNNELLVNGKTYPLKAGALEYYGNESGNHSSGLILVTTEVNENEEAEDEFFNSIFFEIFTSERTIGTREYKFFEGELANTFSDFSEIKIMTETEDMIDIDNYELTAGVLNIISLNPYEVTFKGKARNWDDETDIVDFEGHYKGNLYEYDYSEE
ncbi:MULTISPECIES: hypothetical protein [Mesonia]|uniref:Uncharacterized protein n=1 Tax=Mesonia oceanica TaxID=2687242 RepID=A0AC61Y3T7_9FLAO|nr:MULTISPECIES: hypothetical protein [Mesonia]MAN26898.1 hypothetical protein [Mesonia sp.]MAQ41690.1 hypothetical protein [Mesonia sp.]MBJ96570.1 hypothetical protein [Flavobacteriaceae bacterium]VVU99105.1 hypothetical protein FVB9532_00357 [Mesonia oceanica]|tara:strand:- start:222 stop:773 length:552 start_codon:yes stop_codon:yes gene_type:complete